MDKNKLNKEIEIVNWKYLPDINTLTQYLPRKCLKELSKSCKQIRKQLKFQLIKKLNLMQYYFVLLNYVEYRNLNRKKALDALLEFMEEDLCENLLFVKEVGFRESFNNRFALQFIDLVPNITTIKFYSSYYDRTALSLSTVLHGLKSLKFVEFWISSNDSIILNTDKRLFPRSLVTLKINVNVPADEFLSIFDTVDDSYTNLNFLSIVSNEMLANLTSNMPNLKEVEFLNCWNLDNDMFLKFIDKNPQLTKLSVNFNIVNNEVYSAVLSLKYLKYLNIDKEPFIEARISNLPINNSIIHLRIGKYMSDTHSLQLINSCLKARTVEFYARDFAFDSLIEWDKLERGINTLQLTDCILDDQDIQILDHGKFFERVRFVRKVGVYNAIGQLKYGEMINYRLLPEIGEFPKMFTIVLREPSLID